MRTFGSISRTVKSPNMKAVFDILSQAEGGCYVADSDAKTIRPSKELVVSQRNIDEIKRLMYDEVKGNLVSEGIAFDSLQEAIHKMTDVTRYVTDSFFNPMTGTGIRGVDPGMWNSANTPVSMSPNEATSYYASGGLPAIIIDKKARGALLNGYHFEAGDWIPDIDLQKLKEYAQTIGFDQVVELGSRDALIYGGSIAYPHFKKDMPDTYCYPLAKLVDDGIITKGCIDYFVHADRWNCITVPNYDITARDYLTPDTFFIPIGGIRLATARCAVIRPKKLPYWGALRQIGWSTSDFEGYIRSILAYKIIIASVPIMAQQMSLLVHEIPLDGIIAQNGKETAQQFIDENNAVLRGWSMLNPVTINSFGELKAINRQFANYDELIMSLRQDVAANSGIPESVLFHTLSKGFSDNTEEITLKQSETIKSVNQQVMPSFKTIIKIIVASCFGVDSPYFERADQIKIVFESPEVVTNEERGKLLEKFTMGVKSLVDAGVNVKDAVAITEKFLPDIRVPQDVKNRLSTKEKKEEIPPGLAMLNKEKGGESADEEKPDAQAS
jgi:hypothetical protein